MMIIKRKGVEVLEMVSDAQAEGCDFMVCVRADQPTPFHDNFTGLCCRCGVKIQYRWHAPRKPKRVCVDCVVSVVGKAP